MPITSRSIENNPVAASLCRTPHSAVFIQYRPHLPRQVVHGERLLEEGEIGFSVSVP